MNMDTVASPSSSSTNIFLRATGLTVRSWQMSEISPVDHFWPHGLKQPELHYPTRELRTIRAACLRASYSLATEKRTLWVREHANLTRSCGEACPRVRYRDGCLPEKFRQCLRLLADLVVRALDFLLTAPPLVMSCQRTSERPGMVERHGLYKKKHNPQNNAMQKSVSGG